MAIDTTFIETRPGALDLTDPVAPPPTLGPAAPAISPEHSPPAPIERPAPQFEPSVRYLPALDGMRALAVAAVLLYHGDVSWLPGGFLGVEVFFVISGYLITSLLLAERQSTGATAYLAFWARRARRLLPALFALLAVVSAVWLIKVPGEAARIRGDVVSALAYVTNWYQIVVHQSYFEAIGRPSPLRHLWSLAVEEQFYLVWPVVLAGLVRLTRGRRGRLLVVIVALAAASAAWGIRLYHPGLDPSRASTTAPTPAPPACCSVPPWPWRCPRGSCGPGCTSAPAPCSTWWAWSAWPASAGCSCTPTSSTRWCTRAASWCSTCSPWPPSPPWPIPAPRRGPSSSGWAPWCGSAAAPTGSTCGTGRSSYSPVPASTSPCPPDGCWPCAWA